MKKKFDRGYNKLTDIFNRELLEATLPSVLLILIALVVAAGALDLLVTSDTDADAEVAGHLARLLEAVAKVDRTRAHRTAARVLQRGGAVLLVVLGAAASGTEQETDDGESGEEELGQSHTKHPSRRRAKAILAEMQADLGCIAGL
jgi:hypothetical protein